VLIGLGGLVALAVVAMAAFVLTFDANRYKPRIIAAVRDATGRTLTLTGPIGIKLSLHPTIEAKDVALANPPGFSRPDMARLQALDLQLSLPALLQGTVAIDRLALVRPDILLERTKAGAVNWSFAPATPAGGRPAGAAPAPASAGSPAGAGVFVQDLRIEDGTIGYRDDATGKQTTVTLRQASVRAASPEAPLQLDATAALNGTLVTLAGTAGPLAALVRPAAAPWPIRLALTAGTARLAADGTIADPAAGRGLALGVNLSVPDLAALGKLAGTALPPLKQIVLTGRLVAPGALAQGATLQDVALSLPQGKLAGTLGLQPGRVPKITGTLTSARLDADALLAAFRQPAAPAASGAPTPGRPGPAGGAPATGGSGRVFPDTPLPFHLLRLADADLNVSVAALQTGGETWRNLAFHLVLAGGRLVVAPFTAASPAGALSLRLTVDAARPVPPVAVVLRAPGVALASLLALAGQKGLARGDVAIDADLRGAGTSPHAIAAGLDGVVAATMTGGTIDNAVVNRLLGAALAKANVAGLLSQGGPSDIRCLALRLVVRHGVGRLDPFLFSSTLNTIDGSGTVNLGPETLDLLLHPQGRVGGTGFAVPVRVSGSVLHPVVALSQGAAAEAGIGAALSLLGGGKVAVPQGLQATAPSCASALALARGQRPPAAPPAPAPAQATHPSAAPPNPADLLHNLFR
jgi:uncharacterized protein involved in outer membrane biogenesis